MKKSIFSFVIMAFVAIVFNSCGDASVPDAYIGKWDMTNDKNSHLQQTIELKEDGTFTEHWTAYNDDGELFGELDIQGSYERPATEGYHKALCLIYNLETLNDENSILESIEDEDYFKNWNEQYEAANKQGKVYGFQSAYVEGSFLRFNGGKWKLIDENMEKLFEESK